MAEFKIVGKDGEARAAEPPKGKEITLSLTIARDKQGGMSVSGSATDWKKKVLSPTTRLSKEHPNYEVFEGLLNKAQVALENS